MPPGLMPVRSGNWRKSGTGPDHNPAENRRRARSVDFSADFRTPPGTLRACAHGGLVARTGRPRLPFPVDSL